MLKKRLIVLAVSALFILISSVSNAGSIDVSRILKNKDSISVHVSGFADDTGGTRISANDFKQSFEAALLKRKSIKFEIAKNHEASDIEISGTIKKYQYLASDPVTTFASPTGLLLDAMTTENYVTMETEFQVVETRTRQTIWKDRVSAFLKRKMTKDESVPLIYDKLSRTFLWKCFGKPSAFARDVIHSR